jgi:hypothetical protein
MMKLIYTVLVISVLASCTAAKKAQQVKPVMAADTTKTTIVEAPETVASVLSKLNHIDYNTFSGKADVDYTSDGKGTGFNIKLQMYKDSLIWISVTGPLDIEGARALITKDSVKIINKLQREYILTSISYLQEKTGLPLDLKTMQDLLIGNPVFLDKDSSTYIKNNGNIEITSQTKYFKNFLVALLPGYLPSSSKLDDIDANRNRSAELYYSNYQMTDKANFSQTRNIKVNYKKVIAVHIDFKSWKFNQELNTHFSIPSGYTKAM